MSANDDVRDALTARPHPAIASTSVLKAGAVLIAAEAERVGVEPLAIFDPFAGIGGMFAAEAYLDLPGESMPTWWGVELEPEWASQHSAVRQGDATALPWPDATMNVLWTSPCYGNRLADHHDAQDECKACAGTGVDPAHEVMPTTCRLCRGTGLSPRRSYRSWLGRMPSAGSSATLQWGAKYRQLHDLAWAEAWRVLRPGGLALVNVSNHLRTVGPKHDRRQVVQRVVEYHLSALMLLGGIVEQVVWVDTPRARHGANWQARVEGERILALRKPEVIPA